MLPKRPASSNGGSGSNPSPSRTIVSKHPRYNRDFSMSTATAAGEGDGIESSPRSQPQINVGVLGATGTVGQRFITLLSSHPWFVLHRLGASPRSAGKKYRDAVNWKQSTPIPSSAREMMVYECKPEHFADCAVVFSGLDADAAGDIESAFRSANLCVFSNAKNYRRDPNVPLIVPFVNPNHLSIIPQQQSLHTPPLTKGFIVTNANCSTTGIVIPLAALERAFGPLELVLVTTMQAISGAGFAIGVGPSMRSAPRRYPVPRNILAASGATIAIERGDWLVCPTGTK
ncbi:hypothetical protein NMY22_g16439 [Coprinellus aureogranulatus]|nr:hypothetical protein NMY22_g16439 [Coprinellus aureogranulatus]